MTEQKFVNIATLDEKFSETIAKVLDLRATFKELVDIDANYRKSFDTLDFHLLWISRTHLNLIKYNDEYRDVTESLRSNKATSVDADTFLANYISELCDEDNEPICDD